MADKTIVLVGTAKYINRLNMKALSGIETIGCNRILLHPHIKPTHLVIADRRQYILENSSGRLEKYAKSKGDLWLSDTIWNRKISCGNTPVQREPRYPHKVFKLGAAKAPLNWSDFKKPMSSCANTGMALFQFAKLFGATRIGCVGIGFVDDTNMREGHCYTRKHGEDPHGRQRSPERAIVKAETIRDDLRRMGIRVYNLSLENGIMESVFGKYSFDKFIKETK